MFPSPRRPSNPVLGSLDRSLALGRAPFTALPSEVHTADDHSSVGRSELTVNYL